MKITNYGWSTSPGNCVAGTNASRTDHMWLAAGDLPDRTGIAASSSGLITCVDHLEQRVH